ncbi:hypothetical protein LKO27_11255 [Tessaracoccus sp. OS52]|uniref:hypothetical protein n=1 Tax=Tessaracoccus sp. OS52 TaxID=2886691 RepID=UPI001D124BBC|nr:hypothetical protein [Tessaracoccus sp. OS52]MCC2593983.1 hypothetical protein [Tessaracoccus sp. OS52]
MQDARRGVRLATVLINLVVLVIVVVLATMLIPQPRTDDPDRPSAPRSEPAPQPRSS